jgi:hypothetical protein
MKRFLPLLCLLPLLLTADILLSQSALNDVTAMAKAKTIWGTSAAIGRFRVFGAVNWTFQVGCVITGGNGAFIVAGSSCYPGTQLSQPSICPPTVRTSYQ